MTEKASNLWIGLLALTSMLIAAIGYVYGHKPFTAETLLGLLTACWQVLAALGLLSLAAGVGERALSAYQAQGLERSTVALAAGIGIVGLVVFFLGISIGFNIWVNLPLFLIGLFVLRAEIRAWWERWRDLTHGLKGRVAHFFAFGVIFLLTAPFLRSLAPPSAFDTLVYHFSLPRMYLDAGRLVYVPELMYWGMPQLTEMHYLLAMQIAGPESAANWGWWVGVSALAGIFGFVKNRFGAQAGWVAAATLVAGETTSSLLSWGYVEWHSILYGMALVVVLVRWLENQQNKEIILAGILTGFALSIKYTNGLMLILSLAVVFLCSKQNMRIRIAQLFTLGLVALLVSLPWWLKNFAVTGNPFYPLLFPAGEMTLTRLWYFRSGQPFGNWFTLLTLPWQAAILGIEGKAGFSASIGTLLVGLSPLAWVGWKTRNNEQKRALLVTAIFTLSGFLLWAFVSRFSALLMQSRLFFGFFPAWAILAAAGFHATWRISYHGIRFGRLATALAALLLAFNMFSTLSDTLLRNPGKYLLRLETAQTYLTRSIGQYPKAMERIHALPDGSRILMLWETRGFYCLPVCEPDETIDRWVNDIRQYDSAHATLEAWKSQGFSHILLERGNQGFILENDGRITNAEWTAFDELIDRLIQVEQIGESYLIYKIP
jgi:hypothetical protein